MILNGRIGRLWAISTIPRNSVCAEIGVWKGSFSRWIARRRPAELHLIDPWKFEPTLPDRMWGGTIAKNQSDMNAIMQSVADCFSDNKRVTINRRASAEAAEAYPNGYFDWIYIDGDHRYEAVLSDLNSWFYKVKPGGKIAMDDYSWPDVRSAIHDFLKTVSVKKTRTFQGQFVIYR